MMVCAAVLCAHCWAVRHTIRAWSRAPKLSCLQARPSQGHSHDRVGQLTQQPVTGLRRLLRCAPRPRAWASCQHRLTNSHPRFTESRVLRCKAWPTHSTRSTACEWKLGCPRSQPSQRLACWRQSRRPAPPLAADCVQFVPCLLATSALRLGRCLSCMLVPRCCAAVFQSVATSTCYRALVRCMLTHCQRRWSASEWKHRRRGGVGRTADQGGPA